MNRAIRWLSVMFDKLASFFPQEEYESYQDAIALLNKAGMGSSQLLIALCSIPNNRNVEVTIKFMQVLLDEGADPNAIEPGGTTPLMKAAFFYSSKEGPEIIRLLCSYGGNVHQRDLDKCTAMVYACRACNRRNIKELWVQGANVLDDDSYFSKPHEQIGQNTGGPSGGSAKRFTERLIEQLCVLEWREKGMNFW